MEAHEGVGELVVVSALDLLLPHLGRDGVVDVQQGHGVAGHTSPDVLAECAVDVNLAGHGNATGRQPGVDVAGFEPELTGERGPAFVGEGHVLAAALVVLRPIEEGQLELGHALAQIGIVAALAHFLGHFRTDGRDPGVACVLLVAHQQIQLGVLLDLHADLVQALDGGVAGEKVLGTGAEGDDLQVFHTDDRPCDGHEVRNHFGDVLRRAHGVLRDVALQMAHPQVVGAVEHTAVGVAAPIDEVAVPLGGGHEHTGAVKVFGNEGLGGLGAEIAQEHHQGVAAVLVHIGQGFQHIQLVLNGDRALVEVARIGGFDGGAALLAQGDGEAVPGDSDEAKFYVRDVFHDVFLLYQISLAMSLLSPDSRTAAPCPASALSSWASSHLFRAQSS